VTSDLYLATGFLIDPLAYFESITTTAQVSYLRRQCIYDRRKHSLLL